MYTYVQRIPRVDGHVTVLRNIHMDSIVGTTTFLHRGKHVLDFLRHLHRLQVTE